MLSTDERQAAERILHLLDGHTLALRLAGAYAADAHLPLAAVAAELEATHHIKRTPDRPPRAVSVAFQHSLRQLPPGAQTLFALLAAFATGNVGRSAVLDVAEALEIGDEEHHLESLIHRAFVEISINDRLPITADQERLQLHPLLRGFAETMLRHWPRQQIASAHRAIAQYYADYTNATPDQWLGPDEANMTGALVWAHKHHERELVASLCAGLQYYWRDRGRIPASRRYLPWGMNAAEAISEATNTQDDRLRAVHLALSYGIALKESGELDKAETIFKRNLALRRKMGDRAGEGRALSSLGQITQSQGKLEQAEEYFQEALAISRETQDRQGEGANLTYLGQIAQARGRITEAEKHFQAALDILRKVADRRGEGADLSALARVALERRHFAEAETLAQQSLAIRREMGDVLGEAGVVSLIGQLSLARGNLAEAEQHFLKSLEIRRTIEDRHGEAEDLSQLGRLYLDRGQFDTSAEHFQQSLALFRAVRARAQEGVVLSQLGLVAIERGQLDEAASLLTQSLDLRRDVQDPRGEGVDLALLGRIQLEKRHFQKALMLYERSLAIARTVENERGVGVNLRQLGVIAEQRRRFKQAEAHYRQALAIARNVENRLDVANTCRALGSFLCRVRKQNEEGCALLQESIAAYAKVGAPGEALARQEAARLGCISLPTEHQPTSES